MKWETLLNADRLGYVDAPVDEFRSPFQRDYDRIVFTPAFRRLQDKTQVFPLSSSDYVRTRLTHSIEVSCVARNLGTIVGRRLRKQNLLPPTARASDFGNIAASAALAHDLGNPPFGHSGEAAIQHWFLHSKVAKEMEASLSDAQILEFKHYEGNAHAFRLVTRLLTPKSSGGLQLTYATLATLVKYPIGAHGRDPKYAGHVSAKKYNFFEAEAMHFREVADAVGLIVREPGKWWCRHPLAFVCEAADDITNRIVDLEDGFRLGCIKAGDATDLLMDVLTDLDRKKYARSLKDEKERVGFLRAVVITQLVSEAADTFLANHKGMMAGTFDEEIYAHLPSAAKLEPIRSRTVGQVYTDHRVLGVETAGFEIIYQLLERFTEAALDELKANKKDSEPCTRSKKILGLLPQQYRFRNSKPIKRRYDLLLAITDFVAGMTDGYAVETFQRITGQKFVT